jgi:hypothetical protein
MAPGFYFMKYTSRIYGGTTGKSGRFYRFGPGTVIEAPADEFPHISHGDLTREPIKSETITANTHVKRRRSKKAGT